MRLAISIFAFAGSAFDVPIQRNVHLRGSVVATDIAFQTAASAGFAAFCQQRFDGIVVPFIFQDLSFILAIAQTNSP